MKYKPLDKVRIKSLDWYNENKDEYDYIDFGKHMFYPLMSKYCGKVFTIDYVYSDFYTMNNNDYEWTDEMIEGLVEEEIKPKFKIGEVVYVIDYNTDLKIQNRIYKNGMWNYIINIESAPFIFYDNELKKKKEYPKTYEECYKIMGVKLSDCYIQGYKSPLLEDLQELLICRDAYWKIAGDEMGLGKPWEPNWETLDKKYNIYNYRGVISHDDFTVVDRCVLVFPTEEMRDAFYENFKELIEQCKELL